MTAIRPVSYSRRVFLLIGIMCAYRMFMAFWLELGNDETYYWLYSLNLKTNYFDHPPLVAYWIRLSTFNLFFDRFEGFIRLGSVLGCALASFFLYKTVALLHSERAGFVAALFYNASFYAGITAGLYILPDSPEMVFWTASMYLMVRTVIRPQSILIWILLGLSCGLCIMSKVSGVFLWIGFMSWVIFYRRNLLRERGIYIALLITAVICSPILLWNIRYDFMTWRYHSDRVEVKGFVLLWRSFGKLVLNQFGLNNPVIVVCTASALIGWRVSRRNAHPALRIFNFIGLPLILILWVISIFRNTVLPHWGGPGFVTLIPVAAIFIAESRARIYTVAPGLGIVVYIFVFTAWALAVRYFPGRMDLTKSVMAGPTDPTLDMFGWRSGAKEFSKIYQQETSTGKMPRDAVVVTSQWWGSHVEYYFCRPYSIRMIGLGEPMRIGEYLWTNKLRLPAPADTAYCIVPASDRLRIPKNYYYSSELIKEIVIDRSGHPAQSFFIYRMKGLTKTVPSIQ